ncbi:PREDICTED: olfactory receptor 12D2-like [Thamnophis sirtalis]|uniref:Olfactory receptor n=1 Tax=Thamnophis sirtalis TaxID=35019 RepID=A0A6I9WYW0_9SAUR|nr:PREDICTED: olfactory receptor 12D2-like [Thamnophis sirtalis]XP_032091928.1 olfactory receptor 12D2-like [Thamnophis elegans]
MKNWTEVPEFILLGLTNDHTQQHILFTVFLLLYQACLLGNGAILVVIFVVPRLHTPMYFFLGHLSFLDICCSTVIVPKMLTGFITEQQTISFVGCLTQMHFFHFLGSSEGMLLGVMAFDRYVAICNPLRYTIIMNKWTCVTLAGATWAAGFFHALMHTVVTSQLWFCGPNLIQHFFCDIKPLLLLACSSTVLNLTLLNIVTSGIALTSFFLTLLSYIYIVTFLFFKSGSWQNHWKAFSTCACHLTVVALLYIPVIFNYILSSAAESTEREMSMTLLYSVITPVLNPLIYTLRNQEVKSALRKILFRKALSRGI